MVSDFGVYVEKIFSLDDIAEDFNVPHGCVRSSRD